MAHSSWGLKIWGGIIYPPDWDRVNWSAQKLMGGGNVPPPPWFLRSCDMAHSSWGLRSFVLFKGEYKWLAYSTLCPVIWEAKRTIFKMHSATLWLVFSNLVQKLLGITKAPVFTPVDTYQLLGVDCGNELVSNVSSIQNACYKKTRHLLVSRYSNG